MSFLDLALHEATAGDRCILCRRHADPGLYGGSGWICIPCADQNPHVAMTTETLNAGSVRVKIGDRYVGTMTDPYVAGERKGQRLAITERGARWVPGVLDDALDALARWIDEEEAYL